MATIIKRRSTPSTSSQSSLEHELIKDDDVADLKSLIGSIKIGKKKLFSSSKSSKGIKEPSSSSMEKEEDKKVEEQRMDDNASRSDGNDKDDDDKNDNIDVMIGQCHSMPLQQKKQSQRSSDKRQQRDEPLTIEATLSDLQSSDVVSVDEKSVNKKERHRSPTKSRRSSPTKTRRSSTHKTESKNSKKEKKEKAETKVEAKEEEALTTTTSLMTSEQEKEFLQDDETLLHVKIRSRAEDSSFYLPVSLMMERELEMKASAKEFNIDPARWAGSKLAILYMASRNEQTQEYNGVVVTGKQVELELDPDIECSDSNRSHTMEWKPWLTNCLKMYYNNGTIRIPADCTGSDILVALEYFGIVYSPDQLVFDSFAAYLRVKLWSDYFTYRSHMAGWITERLMKLPSRHSHAFYTSNDSSEETAYIGLKRAEIFDPDLVLDPEKYDQIESRAVVHDFFCDDEGDEVDSLMREDFRTYLLNQLPGTSVKFDMKQITISSFNKKEYERTRAVLQISFRSASNLPVVPGGGSCSSSVESSTFFGIADSTASTHKAGNLREVPSAKNYPSSISVFSENQLSSVLRSESGEESVDDELLEVASTSVSSIAGKRDLSWKRQTSNSNKRRARPLSKSLTRNKRPPLVPRKKKDKKKSPGKAEEVNEDTSTSKSISKSDVASVTEVSVDKSEGLPVPADKQSQAPAIKPKEMEDEKPVQDTSASVAITEKEKKLLERRDSDLQIDPNVPLPVLRDEGDLRSTVSGITTGDDSYTKETALSHAHAEYEGRQQVNAILSTAAPDIPLPPPENNASGAFVTPGDAISFVKDEVVMKDALKRRELQAQQEQGVDMVTAFKNFTPSLWIIGGSDKDTNRSDKALPLNKETDLSTDASFSKHPEVGSPNAAIESLATEKHAPILLNEDYSTTKETNSLSKNGDTYQMDDDSMMTTATNEISFFSWATCAMDDPERTISDDAAGWMRSVLFPFPDNPCSGTEQQDAGLMNMEHSSMEDSIDQSDEELTDGEESDTGQPGCVSILKVSKQKKGSNKDGALTRNQHKRWRRFRKEERRKGKMEKKEEEKRKKDEGKRKKNEGNKKKDDNVKVLLPRSKLEKKVQREASKNSSIDGNISSPSRRRLPDQLPVPNSMTLENTLSGGSDQTSFDTFEGGRDLSKRKAARRKKSVGAVSPQGRRPTSAHRAVAFSTGTKQGLPAAHPVSSMRQPLRSSPLQLPPPIIQKKKIQQAGTINIMTPSKKSSGTSQRQRGGGLRGMFGRNKARAEF